MIETDLSFCQFDANFKSLNPTKNIELRRSSSRNHNLESSREVNYIFLKSNYFLTLSLRSQILFNLIS